MRTTATAPKRSWRITNKSRSPPFINIPAYPGTGERSFDNIHNFPVAPYTARATHVREVERALQTLLDFKPDLLLVSAGFDAYSGDPLVQMTLEPEDFATFGKWLRECGVATGAILEGGYSDQLPELIDAFLTNWDDRLDTCTR